VVAADPDDLQLGIRVLPVEGPTTSYGWGYTPESLRRVLVRVSDEYTKLPLYVTESGASLHDYVDPEGRINDIERIDYPDRGCPARRGTSVAALGGQAAASSLVGVTVVIVASRAARSAGRCR
jgi:Glycosyl hydrolase family 1